QFVAHGGSYFVSLAPTEAVLSVTQLAAAPAHERTLPPAGATATLKMQFVGANPAARAVAQDGLPNKVNYLNLADPGQSHTDVPTFGRVEYQQVYPGIDVAYHSRQGQLEYDFLVAPGADPRAIRLGFTGADRVGVDGHGDLVLHTGAGVVRQQKPSVYQEVE